MRITARQLRQLIKGEIGKLREAADTDGDGTPDYRDLDSDNDGISDREEGVPKVGALLLDQVEDYIDFYTLEKLTKRKAKKTLRDIFDEMHPHPSLNNDKSKDVMLHYILVAIKKHEEESMDNPWDDDDDPADWLGPEGEYVQEVQRMKLTRSQLRKIINEVLDEAKEEKFMQKASDATEEEGHEGIFSGWCKKQGFEGVNQSCINKAYKAGKPWKKRASLAVTYSRAKGGAKSLKYPEGSKE